MRGLPEESTRDGVSPLADVEKLVVEGRYGRADLALRRLEALIPSLAQTADDETLLLALYGRAVLLRRLGGGHQTAIAACDVLERAAHERQAGLWAAIACAARAQFRVDSGDIGGATADLARADSALAGDELTDDGGYRLLNGLAVVYAGLRLQDRADEMRNRIEHTISSRSTLDQAEHWATWATELAARAMEPLAGGAQDPQQEFMSRAVELAGKVDELAEDAIPGTLRRGANGVRALAAAYRGRPSEALRLLGPDAFGTVGDLPAAERQIVSLAAMRAHALVGSLATARSLDDAAIAPPATLPNLVLEVCRTRERLWLETYANGEVVPVLQRMTELLVRLGWRGMDLVADTARQALEHQALRTESRTDALTGVGNRRALDEELRQLLRFGPLPLALILVDVDHFKEINDRFTHVVADEVLRRVAASLSLQLRTDDQLLRYAGDEFVVLLPGTGDEEANAVAERMCAAVAARPWNELADGLEVTITTGCAAVWSLSGRRPDADAEKLFRRADERLLAAKRDRPGEDEARPPYSTPTTAWDDDSTDDVAAASMPPTPTRTLGAEVIGPHSRPGSRPVVPQGLNGGRRATDPEFDAGLEATGTPVNGVDLSLPPAGDPTLADVLAEHQIEDEASSGSAAGSGERRYGTTAELPQSAANGASSGTANGRASGGTRRSRRAARDAEAAASPVNGIAALAANGIPVEEQGIRGAEAAASAVAARQAAEAREREQAQETAAREKVQREARELVEREAREQVEREARELVERETRERLEREARERAEREARAKAEREARAKAEREARAKAEREAQERAEREARVKAEREAQERAEREARAKAEREAREKAEREIREREARERAEREARERAERERAAREARQRIEAERREKQERERIEAEARRLAEQIEQERRAAEARAEAERVERERQAALAKAEAERRERERIEAERAERERIERERLERERLERERLEAEARAKAEAERRERERREAEARAKAEAEERARKEAAAKAEAERLAAEKAEKERKEALAKAEAERLERQRVERERRIHEARERAAAARRERETRERAEREEAERMAREQAAREESERLRMEEVRRAAEEIRREAYERAARLAAQSTGNTGSWPTTQGPNTGSWMMPGAAAIESPTTPSAPRPGPAEQSEADRRFQQTAAEIYRPDPHLGPSTETFRALSDPLNDPVPSRNPGSSSSGSSSSSSTPAADSYSGSQYGSGSGSSSSSSYGSGSESSYSSESGSSSPYSSNGSNGSSGSGYPSATPSSSGYPGSAFDERDSTRNARDSRNYEDSRSSYGSNGSAGYPSPYSNEPEAPWESYDRSTGQGPAPSSPSRGSNGSANGWPDEDDEVDLRDQPEQLPGTGGSSGREGRRDPLGPPTSRQAIIDLSARRRHRNPSD